MNTQGEEFLDLVDSNDRVIGVLARSQVQKQHLTNFRVINAFIINTQNQIWIPRRTKDKEHFPRALDVSVGGHVGSGDGLCCCAASVFVKTTTDLRCLGQPRRSFMELPAIIILE